MENVITGLVVAVIVIVIMSTEHAQKLMSNFKRLLTGHLGDKLKAIEFKPDGLYLLVLPESTTEKELDELAKQLNSTYSDAISKGLRIVIHIGRMTIITAE